MALGFPPNPNIGDKYTLGNNVYVWNGAGWAITATNPSTINQLTATNVIVTTSTNSTSTTTGGLVVSGGVGVGGNVNSGGNITAAGTLTVTQVQIADAIMYSTSATVTSTNATVIDQYLIRQYRTAKYLIQVDNGDSLSFEAIELLVMATNTGTVKATDYGLLQNNGELGNYETMVDNNGGDPLMKLYFTAFTATNKTVKLFRTAITT